MEFRLKNKIAFITGGNSGIGLATAQEFAKQGAKVLILARSKEKADQALLQIDGDAEGYVGDVSDLDSIRDVCAQIATKHKRLDIVVANAGIAPMTPFGQVTETSFDEIFDVNVKGSFFTVQNTLDLLGKGSSVILISSCLNEMGMEGFSLYNASKAAIRSLARSLTPDLAAKGARINVLSPGPIHTPALSNVGISEAQIAALHATFSTILPAGRVGQPEEIAKAALFLASDDSSFMLGSEIQADGGMNQTRWPNQIPS